MNPIPRYRRREPLQSGARGWDIELHIIDMGRALLDLSADEFPSWHLRFDAYRDAGFRIEEIKPDVDEEILRRERLRRQAFSNGMHQ